MKALIAFSLVFVTVLGCVAGAVGDGDAALQQATFYVA